MAVRKPRLLLDGLTFPEGPRWHDGRLWFSDMHGFQVAAVDVGGRRETIAHVPTRPSGIGWLPDGTALVVSMEDRRLLRLEGRALSVAADLGPMARGYCNDMVVDSRGRAYVGTFGFDLYGGAEPRPANLVMAAPGGAVTAVADDLAFPNGMAVTPDGATLVVAETRTQRLTAFHIQEDGSLSERRVWAQLDIRPDGICLDAEGCIWVAGIGPTPSFQRVAEGGAVRESIAVEEGAAFACMLGGPDRRTLFLLEAISSRPGNIGPGNGWIRAVEVDVPGAGLP